MMHAVVLIVRFWGVVSLIAAIFITLVALGMWLLKLSDEKLTLVRFYTHVSRCVEGGACPYKEKISHVIAERLAWVLMRGRFSKFRCLAGLIVLIFTQWALEWFFYPVTLSVRGFKHLRSTGGSP